MLLIDLFWILFLVELLSIIYKFGKKSFTFKGVTLSSITELWESFLRNENWCSKFFFYELLSVI